MLMKSPLPIGSLLILLFSTLLGGQVAAQQQQVIPFDANGWAVDELTGRVFASSAKTSEVVEFNRDGKVRTFQVGADPSELLLKGDRLVVACTKSPSLTVIDLDTNQVVGSVALEGSGPYALFCSQTNDHYVYCICNTGNAWWDGEVFQVALAEMTVRKRSKVQPWGQSHPLHVAMSRDGKWIVPDARGVSSPSGADLMRVDADELTFKQIRDYHESFGQIVAGPWNRYWTFGNTLYSLDITRRIRTFKGSPVTIHPNLNLVASLSDGAVALERFSDAGALGFVKLLTDAKKSPASRARPPRQPRWRVGMDPIVKFDLANFSVFVGLHSSGHWIDLKPYRNELEPLRMIQIPSAAKTLVGETLRIPLSVINDDADSKVQIVIKEGPDSARLEGNEIVWTPAAEHVGTTEFQLVGRSTANNEVFDTANLSVQVVLPQIELGFVGRSMSLSPNGKVLAVWGPASGQPNRHPMQAGPDELAIIDTRESRVLVKKSLPQGIRSALVDDRYVILSPNSGNLFYRLDHKLEVTKRQFLQSQPNQLVKISPNQLAVIGSQLEVFDLDQMKPDAPLGLSRVRGSQPNGSVEVLSSHVVRVGQRVVDSVTGKLYRLIPGPALPSIANAPARFTPMPSHTGSKVWGRRLNGGTLFNDQDSRIATLPNVQHGVLSERWPLAIFTGHARAGRSFERTLMLCDLIEGTVRHSAVVDTTQDSASNHFVHQGHRQLLAHEETVYLLNGDQLLVTTIPKSIAEEVPVPAHFSRTQPTESKIEEIARLKLGVAGQAEGTTYAFANEYEGIELDAATGELTIDGKKLWQRFLDGFSNPSQNRSVESSGESLLASTGNSAGYRVLLDKELPQDRFAFQVPLSILLRDSEGQQDIIDFAIVMTAPRKELEEVQADLRRKRDQARAEMLARQQQQAAERQAAAMQAARAAKDETDTSIVDRLDAMEARMRRIEAALDSILQRLEKETP